MAHLRDSMYPTPSYDFLTPLDDCAATTSSCVQVLGSGMEKLGRGTRDLPRLSKVLKNEHVRETRMKIEHCAEGSVALPRPPPTCDLQPSRQPLHHLGTADRPTHLESRGVARHSIHQSSPSGRETIHHPICQTPSRASADERICCFRGRAELQFHFGWGWGRGQEQIGWDRDEGSKSCAEAQGHDLEG